MCNIKGRYTANLKPVVNFDMCNVTFGWYLCRSSYGHVCIPMKPLMMCFPCYCCCCFCGFIIVILSRPDLKLVLMSATLNAEMFSAYFGMYPLYYCKIK